jgi:hypothetical protein
LRKLSRDIRVQAQMLLDRAHPLDKVVDFFGLARNVFHGGFKSVEPVMNVFEF